MALLTNFLKLFKWNTEDENDLEQQFDIDKAMNDNWDKLDEAIEDLDTNKVDKVDGKGLSTNDFTNEDKEKLDGLENYDDTEITQEIEDIQEEQAKQNEDIEDLKQINAKQDDLIQKLKDNSINVTTEEATSLHVENASTVPAKLEVRGNHSQKVTKIAENVFDGKLESGAWDYNTGQKTDNSSQMRSVDYIDISGQTQISIVKKDGGTFTCGIRYYDAEKNHIGRVSLNDVTDAITTTIVNNIDDTKSVKYATLTFTHSTDTSEVFGLNKGADLTWHDFIPNSPSLDYPSPVRAVGDNVNILPNKATSKSIAEIDWTVNSNGSIHAKGTATSNSTIDLITTSDEIFNFKKGIAYKNVGNVDICYKKTDGDYGRFLKGAILELEEDMSVSRLYLQVNSGVTVDETYYPKIVEYYEGIDESYSPYEQGSVEVKKINSNIMPILNLGSRWEYTENGLKNLLQNAGSKIFDIFLKKGQTIKLNFRRMSVISKTNSCSFTVYVDKVQSTNLNFTNFQDYSTATPSPIYTRTYTAEKDCEIYAILWGNSEKETFEFQLWANLENTEDYEKYQEQVYTLPIQQPMLQGDYFEREADGWKEVHGFDYVDTKNVETLEVNLSTSSPQAEGFYRYNINLGLNNRKSGWNLKLICTHFENKNVRWNITLDGICGWENGYNLCIGTHDENYDTADRMKTFLQNNDVGIYYELATPTKLPCTSEQSKVLDQLSELDLFKGTNNIITAESLALIQMQYIADTETYIDNRIDEKLANINQQILEIAGGK